MTLSESHTRRWSDSVTWLGASVLFFAAASAAAAGPTVYTYVDDEGTTIFTEQLQSIPERYRDRVQVMSRAEEERLERQAKEAREKKASGLGGIGAVTGLMGGAKPQPSQAPAAAPETVQETPGTESPSSPLSFLPPLSDYQKAAMGIGFGVAVILYVMMKMNRSFGVRLFLRLLLMIVLFGTSYMVYFSGLSAKFAEMTGQSAAAGGKGGFQSPTELLKQAKEAAQQMQRSQQETVNVLQQMEKE